MARFCAFAVACALLSAGVGLAPASAEEPAAVAPAVASKWVTLGTRGGPIADPERSQPANALVVGNATYLVDCGDGTVEQLAKAGLPLAGVRAVLLSHLHFDHTGGLYAVLGLRWQTNVDAPLTIYGPPGTRQLVDGLLAAMQPSTASGYGMPGAPARPAAAGIAVVEVRGSNTFAMGDIRVRAAKNTHYSFAAGSADDKAFESLSFRFDLADRSIAYTGDTGPSEAVAVLASGVDLLVAEMIDVDRTMADVRRTAPSADQRAQSAIEAHLRAHHLAPTDVGRLAAAAGAKSLIVTHFVAPRADGRVLLGFMAEIGRSYRGPVAIARDLEGY